MSLRMVFRNMAARSRPVGHVIACSQRFRLEMSVARGSRSLEQEAPLLSVTDTANAKAAPVVSLSRKDIVLYSLGWGPRSAVVKFSENWSDLFFADVWKISLSGLSLWNTSTSLLAFLLQPMVSWMGDGLRSKYGRRRPVIFVCMPFAVVSFIMSFWVPAGMSTASIRAYYIAAAFIGTFDFSVGPLNAWGAELTPDPAARVVLYSWTNVVSFVGNIAGAALPPLLVQWCATLAGDGSGSEATGDATRVAYAWFGGITAVGFVLTTAFMLLWLPEPPHLHAVVDKSTSPVPAIIAAVQNAQYLRYAFTGFFSRLGPSQVSGAVFVLVYRHLFGLSADSIGLCMLSQMGAGAVSSEVWSLLGKRVENRTGFLLSLIPLVVSDLALAFAAVKGGDAFSLALGLVCAALQGVGASGGNIFGSAIYSDCVDYDELHSGRRREAQYDGAQRLVWYVANIIFAGLPYALFASSGYNASAAPDTAQPTAFLTVLRGLLLVGVGTDVAQAVAIWGYRITRPVHAAIMMALEATANGQAATDPVTGLPLHTPESTASVADFLDIAVRQEAAAGDVKRRSSVHTAGSQTRLSRVSRGFSTLETLLRRVSAELRSDNGGITSGLDHFFDWELKLALRSDKASLRVQVAGAALASVMLAVATCLVAAPFYSSEAHFYVFSALMNVVVAAAFLLLWSGFRWRAAQSADPVLRTVKATA